MSPLTLYRADGTPKTTVPGGFPVPMEVVHYVGGVGEPAFQNGWKNFDNNAAVPGSGSNRSAAFRKDPFGKVRLTGVIQSGTLGNIAFTLPIGYRPVRTSNVNQAVDSGGGTASIDIYSTGNVVVSAVLSSNPSSYCYLDGVEFDTELVTAMPSGPPGPAGPQGPVGGNATVLMDTWHAVGAVGEPAFQNGWTNFGGGEATAAYRKDPLGRVQVRGTVKGGASGTVMFTLPVGYRPIGNPDWQTPTASGSSSASLSVASNGVVSVGTVGTTVQATWLDVIEFDTDTVTAMPTGPKGDKGDTGGNATVPMDTWHVVGAVGEPAYTAGGGTLRFRKDPLGRVWVYGNYTMTASPQNVFTLPVGYRPIADYVYDNLQQSAQAGSYVQVFASSGIVQITGATLVGYLDLSFDTGLVTAMPTGPQGPQGPAGNSVTVPIEAWNLVGPGQSVTFQNSWVASDSNVYYRKDPLGRVYLRGSLNGGNSGTIAFTLPVGYRPALAGQTRFRGIAVNIQTSGQWEAQINIGTDGTVLVFYQGATPATAVVSLDQIDFDSGTVTAMPTGPKGDPGNAAVVPVVSSLPANPTDGQQIDFQDANMAAQGVRWRFVYRANSVLALKWEFAGGGELLGLMTGGNQNLTTAAANTTCQVPVPLAGVYEVRARMQFAGGVDYYLYINGAGMSMQMISYHAGATTPNLFLTGMEQVTLTVAALFIAIGSGTAAGFAASGSGRLWIRPVRVG